MSWENKPQKQKWEWETVLKQLASPTCPSQDPTNSPCFAFAVSERILTAHVSRARAMRGVGGGGRCTVLSAMLGLTHSVPPEPSSEERRHAGQQLTRHKINSVGESGSEPRPVSYPGIQQSFTGGHHYRQPITRTALRSSVATGPVSAKKRGVKVALPLLGRGVPPLQLFCPPSPSLDIIMDTRTDLEVPLDPGSLDVKQIHRGQLSWEPPPRTVNSVPARNLHLSSSVTGCSGLFLTAAECGLF